VGGAGRPGSGRRQGVACPALTGAGEKPRIEIGLVAAPGLAAELAHALEGELAARLTELYPEAEWHVDLVVDGLVNPPAATTELLDAAHRRLLAEDWKLALCLTDLPLRVGRRAMVGHASPTHRLAIVSVPALGGARRRRRALDTAVGLLRILIGQPPEEPAVRSAPHPHRLLRRLVNLAELGDEAARDVAGLAALVRGGRLRLLGGMVRANRPWRLTARLYRALIAALAAAALALVTSDVWRIATSLSVLRLALLTFLCVTLTVVSLIAAHDLWERGRGAGSRDQVHLFNAATALTVFIGVVSLYALLVAVTFAGAGLVITSTAFSEAIGSDAGLADYLKLTWLASSLATVGGALGAALESDAAIREAAYAYRLEPEAAWSAAGAD
jgi:hypothetical protein